MLPLHIIDTEHIAAIIAAAVAFFIVYFAFFLHYFRFFIFIYFRH